MEFMVGDLIRLCVHSTPTQGSICVVEVIALIVCVGGGALRDLYIYKIEKTQCLQLPGVGMQNKAAFQHQVLSYDISSLLLTVAKYTHTHTHTYTMMRGRACTKCRWYIRDILPVADILPVVCNCHGIYYMNHGYTEYSGTYYPRSRSSEVCG